MVINSGNRESMSNSLAVTTYVAFWKATTVSLEVLNAPDCIGTRRAYTGKAWV